MFGGCHMATQKVWFITGCSSGLGRALAEAALQAGANVAITARTLSDIEHFAKEFPQQALTIPLDVTNSQQVQAAIAKTIKQFGHIDILVNNAGYGLIGAIEEIPDKEVRKLFDTNFFGLLDVTRAVLPSMRAQKSGHIINISAAGGIVATPFLGIFNASKFAVEGLTESLAEELDPLGIKVTLVEPGPSRTNFIIRSTNQKFTNITDYDESRHFMNTIFTQYIDNAPGNPQKVAQAIVNLTENPVPPLHLPMGKFTVERIREKLTMLQDNITDWEAISNETDFKK